MNQATTTPASTVTPPAELPYRMDHDAWVRYLREHLAPDGTWRQGEFDPARWLFTGDPENPQTTSTRCRVAACDTIVSSHCLCGSCLRAFAASRLDQTTLR